MWVSQIQIQDVKCFKDSGPIEFSKSINLLLAPNNSGKTTILRCLYSLQESDGGVTYPLDNGRLDGNPQVDVILSDITEELKNSLAHRGHNSAGQLEIKPMAPIATVHFERNKTNIRGSNGNEKGFTRFKAQEGMKGPDFAAWIYPFLSNRKKTTYDPKISAANRRQVSEIPNQLYSKIDAVLTAGKLDFTEACQEVLGIPIGCVQVDEGKIAGFVVDDRVIPISQMGEGTRNLLQIIRDLIVSKNNLFLLEEPENDIHPKALKALLRLILKKADENQFIISTHSNIVAKYLGGQAGTKIFTISCDFSGPLPTATVGVVSTVSSRDRIKVLEDLEYDIFDYDLWGAYLLLEESSAERIINDLLIPDFVPELKGRLKTIACGGITKVAPKFEDFHRLFVFVHSAPVYEKKAWVYVDGDKNGIETIEKLQKAFDKNWSAEHFQTWSKKAFEEFYPPRFSTRAAQILEIQNKEERRQAKKELLNEVISWIEADRGSAHDAFAISAAEVIAALQKIAAALK